VFLRSYGFEMAPVLIGFILGPMLERYFRRSIQLGRGEVEYFVSSGISIFFLSVTALLLVLAVLGGMRSVMRSRPASGNFRSLGSE